jgi:hypothetical protein
MTAPTTLVARYATIRRTATRPTTAHHTGARHAAHPTRGGDAMTSQVDTVIAPPATRRLSARVRELGTLAQVEKLSPAVATQDRVATAATGQAVAR